MVIKKKFIFLLLICLMLSIVLIYYFQVFGNDTAVIDKNQSSPEKTIEEITKHYSEKVMILSDSSIYEHDTNNYKEIGTISKDTVLILDHIENITENTSYFKIKDTDFYIKYSDVSPYLEELGQMEHYMSFNERIKTNAVFHLYYNEKKQLTINKSMEFPILMKLDDFYLAEFNNRYFYVDKKEVESISPANNSNDLATNIAVLNYHFFYDSSKEKCNQIICLEKSDFEEQLLYLKENDFKTLTMNEFNLWMDKKIVLPKKSVLLTIDDGALGTDTYLIELLEKYNMKATLFLITAWWEKSKYDSPNLEIHSHGYDIHLENYCKGVNRGARGLCLTKEELVYDFTKSKELLNNNTFAFAYPYYLYNDNMISALKETGFELAFIGGNKKVKQTDNKYIIPRYIIYSYTSIDNFKKMVN